MQAIKAFVPTMLGGAADLVESTKTELRDAGVFSATHAGRNIAFGIREHGMGSIVNGLALHGGIVKPYGSTFLVFSDYMRPAVRLSALMHAAGDLGVDARLDRRSARTGRRTSRSSTTRRCARSRISGSSGPGTRTRPPSPGRSRSTARTGRWRFRSRVRSADARPLRPRRRLGRRAGCLRALGVGRARSDPDRTGSEVSLALDAGRRIAAENGTAVRVVSMPCWELFEQQPQSYRDEVLPPEVRARLCVEAGVAQGWERWVGDQGDSLALDRYGASAPGPIVWPSSATPSTTWSPRATAVLERTKQHV